MSISSLADAGAARRVTASAVMFVLALSIAIGGAPAGAAAAEASAEPLPPLRVVDVKGVLALGSPITLTVSNLRSYLALPGKDPKNLVLYLNGWPIRGLNSQLLPSENMVRFDVQRTDASTDAWNDLLGGPSGRTRKVSVSIGYGTGESVPTAVEKYDLRVVVSVYAWWGAGFAFLLVLLLFLRAAWTTSIIREPSGLPPAERPYSLGRTQMAFWFFAVLGSFIFIWMMTGAIPPISESALALTGISAATALGARLVDVGKDRDAERNPANPGSATVKARTAFAAAALKGEDTTPLAEKAAYPRSRGFFPDVLSDAEGYSLHRTQILVWTVVLGAIFVWMTYKNLSMPEFGATMLALMGISGGTYVGFKYPEPRA